MPKNPKVTNTSKQSPAQHLLGMAASTEVTGNADAYIMGMEARGQEELVANGARLPAQGTVDEHINSSGAPIAELWKSFGVVIGEHIKDDEIWVHATLPGGWRIKATDHSMWTHLVDDKGRTRGEIFYKGAFYDHSCFIRPSRRFNTDIDQPEQDGPFFGIITDGGTEIHRVGPFVDDEGERPAWGEPGSKDWFSGYDKGIAAANIWRTKKYPDWETITAYWD